MEELYECVDSWVIICSVDYFPFPSKELFLHFHSCSIKTFNLCPALISLSLLDHPFVKGFMF